MSVATQAAGPAEGGPHRPTRAIVLAAGQGTRLGSLTAERPKCMVELAGRPLLHHQLDVLRAAGIDELHLVTGYRAERIEADRVTRWVNERYATTNMVVTLFCAQDAMRDDADLVISYGDIVYEPRVLAALLAVDAPLVVAVDRAWRDYWQARMDDPLADAETLKLGDDDRIVELGRKPRGYEDIEGQYLGLIRVRADHVDAFVAAWRGLDPDATIDGRSVDQMYMTSFLQHLIDAGWDARAAFTDNGWLEVDEPGDLALDVARFWRPGVGA